MVNGSKPSLKSIPPQIEIPNRPLRPTHGQIPIAAEGQWTSTLARAEPDDWKRFNEDEGYLPTASPIQVQTIKANDGQANLDIPSPNQNYIAHISSGQQSTSAWILPENLNVTHLASSNDNIILISGSEGPISGASFVHPHGTLISNELGHIKISSKRITDQSHVSWQGNWHPILKESDTVSEAIHSDWNIHLDRSIASAGEILSAYGWTPKPNSTIHWSVASNEQLDVLQGQIISGPKAEVDLKVPLPPGSDEYHLIDTRHSDPYPLFFNRWPE